MASGKISKTVIFCTNYRCNLACSYCYEDKSSTKTFDVELYKSILTKHLKEPAEGRTEVSLHGGEPFLVFDKIRELCEWAWAQNFPADYIFFSTSNGTLVHGEIQECLTRNKHRFQVGISLDGTPEMHNRNRSGSFEKIDIAFFLRTWPLQSVKMTLSQETLPVLAEGVLFLKQKGVRNIACNLAYMIDWKDPVNLELFRQQLRLLADYYLDNPEEEPIDLLSDKVVIASIFKNGWRRWCGSGDAMIAYDMDGKAYPCHLFVPSVCGEEKARESAKFDLTQEAQTRDPECAKCPIELMCPICVGANYVSFGKVNCNDKSMCDLHKTRIVEICNLSYKRALKRHKLGVLTGEELKKAVNAMRAIQKLKAELERPAA